MADEQEFEKWMKKNCGFTVEECGPRLRGYLIHCWNHAIAAALSCDTDIDPTSPQNLYYPDGKIPKLNR
jgi:hypothetical protein